MLVVESGRYTTPYSYYAKANAVLADISPIDYFFAKQTSEYIVDRLLNAKPALLLTQIQYSEFFHLLLALHCNIRGGDTCLSLNQYGGKIFGFESDEQGLVSKQGYRFSDEKSLSDLLNETLELSGHEFPVLLHNRRFYLRRFFVFEQEVMRFVKEKTQIDVVSKTQFNDISATIKRLFPSRVENDAIDWQKIAVANALNKNFAVIAGGPGTGKTYTVTKLLAAIIDMHRIAHNTNGIEAVYRPLKIALTAPTGKAAQRLSESIGKAINGFEGQIDEDILNLIPRQAQTIHRLLGVIPGQVNFKHNQDNLLAFDVLLIDEVSMVDLPLMARLTRALPESCRVIFLGDADQLPSVGAGCVLADLAPRPHPGFRPNNNKLLKSVCQLSADLPSTKGKLRADHLTFLVHSRRFDGTGGIGRLAKSVISGKSVESWKLLKSADELESDTSVREQLRLLSNKRSVWLAAHVKQFFVPLILSSSLESAFTQLNKYRILCATRVGNFGVEALNEEVESLLQKQGVIPFRQPLYHGKPIMINQNDYHLGLYNGDIGVIWRNDNGQLMAVFEGEQGEYISVMPSRLPQFETVYAMTIHKTQGSEFNHAVIVLPEHSNGRLLSRELLYTGITRGKNKVSVHANKHVWLQTVASQTKRVSGFDLFRKRE